MADITFYFPSTGSAPHDCAYSDYWTNTTGAAHLPMPSTKGSTDIAVRSVVITRATRPRSVGGQWVSEAMPARSWTTADTFDWAMLLKDENAPTTSFVAHISIRIFSEDGSSEVGVLFEDEVNASAWNSTYQSRHCDGVSLTGNVDMPENGHLVVEIGGYANYDASEYSGNLIDGEGSSTAIPLNDTDTNTDHHPWIAFTYGAAPPSGYDNEVIVVFES